MFCKKENNKENDKEYEFKIQNDKDHHIVLVISSFRFVDYICDYVHYCKHLKIKISMIS